MKNLYESILSDIDVTLTDSDIKVTHILIQKYLEDNYNGNWIISEKPNKDGLYEVSSNKSIKVKNKQIVSLTNDLFIWTSVKGYFDCSSCKSLKSLKGAPEEVEGTFYCYDCSGLKSLDGAPKKVEGTFYCRNCSRLESLKGAPKEVRTYFDCSNCGKSFTEDDIKKVSKVNTNIYC